MESSSGVLLAEAVPEPRKRRRIPTWLRISAATVLGLIVLLMAGGMWLFGYVERMFDPEVQWAAIREVIAVDEPLPSYGVVGVPKLDGMRAWGFSDAAGERFGMFLHARGEEDAITKREMFDPEKREVPGNSFFAITPLEHGTIAVQGRDLRYIRFTYTPLRRSSEADTLPPKDRSGPAIVVELPREDPAEFLAFMMIAEGEGSRVEDAQLVDFLKPFHVGPDR